jgi:hypothetical protein
MNPPAFTERGPPELRRLARKQANFPVRLPDQLPGIGNTLGTSRALFSVEEVRQRTRNLRV